jgi:hypothetical protein
MGVDKRPIIPTSTELDEAPRRTKHEDILDYVYDWAAWAAEIPDEARRNEVLGWVMKTLERALKNGMERAGMMLEASDVQGTKNGTKRTLEGEVKIQIVITSSLKEKPGSELNKPAVQKAKDGIENYTQANQGAATAAPSETIADQLLAIEHAAQASLETTKRPASELDEFGAAQDAKRQKVEVAKESKKPLTTKAEVQQEKLRESQDRPTSESITTEDDEKWVQYLQHIFLPRLNHILKRAGESLSRGKCRNWKTVRERLIAAGVSVKYRNMMLRDFQQGHEKWDGDNQVDPNVELAGFAESFQCPPKAAPVVAVSNVDKQAVKKDAESNTSNTQTLLLPLEGLPALKTKTPIPNVFIPAQPVSSRPSKWHTHRTSDPTYQLTFFTTPAPPLTISPTSSAKEEDIVDRHPLHLPGLRPRRLYCLRPVPARELHVHLHTGLDGERARPDQRHAQDQNRRGARHGGRQRGHPRRQDAADPQQAGESGGGGEFCRFEF